jgi:hypothetical protein
MLFLSMKIEADITSDGLVVNARLPSSCRSWFGSHAKFIMILPGKQDDSVQRQQRIQKWRSLLNETKTLAQASEPNLNTRDRNPPDIATALPEANADNYPKRSV